MSANISHYTTQISKKKKQLKKKFILYYVIGVLMQVCNPPTKQSDKKLIIVTKHLTQRHPITAVAAASCICISNVVT